MRRNHGITPKGVDHPVDIDDDQDKLSEFKSYGAGDIYLGGYLGVSPEHIMRGNMDGASTSGQFTMHPQMVGMSSESTSVVIGTRTASEVTDDDVLTPQELQRYVRGLNIRLMALEQAVFGKMSVTEAGMPVVVTPSSGATNHFPRMRDLDSVCHQEFARSPNPSNVDLNRMASLIGSNYPYASRKDILSIVRKWFRKKRDEDGQKVFNACNNILQPMILDGASVEDIKEMLQTDDGLRRRLLDWANLCIADEEQAGLFLDQKVTAYFSRRVLS